MANSSKSVVNMLYNNIKYNTTTKFKTYKSGKIFSSLYL